jgi:hypothetical protein
MQSLARSDVDRLERELLRMTQADIKTDHSFKPGVYERTITVPAWTVLTGAEHLTDYVVRLVKGTIMVTTDDGVKTLVAPCEFVSKAGIKRVGFVQESEVVWTDVYQNPDDCRDLAAIEDRLYVVPKCGLADSRTTAQWAQIDYDNFLCEYNLSYEIVALISQIETDLMDMPAGNYVQLQKSKIHGQGLFATKNFEIGETVCPGRLNGKRTPGGRFINHSQFANVIPKKLDDDIYMLAIIPINVGDELLVDYRQSMQVNFGSKVQGELA